MLINQPPKVTILMPVYNGEKYLHEAIDSMLQQTFTDFEFLIIDDGSNDNSFKIITSYQDPRICLVRNEKNQGLVYTLNRGLSLAKGEYIARMDCDDISLPERLQKQIEFLENYPQISVLGTWIEVINESKETQIIWKYPTESFAIHWNLHFYCSLAHPSVVFKKEVVLSHQGYSQEMLNAEDYDLWRRLIKTESFANLPEILLLYRQHDNNVTKNYRQHHLQKAAQINQSILEEILDQSMDYETCYDFFYQNNQSYQQLNNNVLLTFKIYQKFIGKYHLTRLENQYIRYDTAKKIYNFTRPYVRQFKSWPFLILAFYLSPHLILDFIQSLSFGKKYKINNLFSWFCYDSRQENKKN